MATQDFIKTAQPGSLESQGVSFLEGAKQLESQLGRAPKGFEVFDYLRRAPGSTTDVGIGAEPPIDMGTNINISQGTDGIRANENDVRGQASEALNDLNDIRSRVSSGLQSGLESLQSLSERARQTSELTAAELEQISAAGEQERLRFQPLIAEAQEQFRQGLATSTVRAGELGGFESTQFAGQAALTPTEGGTFVGAGGRLAEIKGTLQNNITRLQSAQQQAIANAEASMRSAIRTGRMEDFQNGLKLFEAAQSAFETESTLAKQLIDATAAEEKLRQGQIVFGQEQEDRALDELNTILGSGAEVPQILQQQIESRFGPGFVDSVREAQIAANQAQSEADNLEVFDKVTTILSRMPQGETLPFTINGETFEMSGFKEGKTKTYKQVNKNTGEVVYITLDNDGNLVNSAVGGNVGVSRGGSGGSTVGGGGNETAPTFEEFVDMKQAEEQQTLNLGDPSIRSELEAEYQSFLNANQTLPKSAEFTRTQQQKLIQAGLEDATTKEKLDFLFNGENSDEFDFDSL